MGMAADAAPLPRRVDREDAACGGRGRSGAAGRGEEGIAEGPDGVEGERAVRARGVREHGEDGHRLAVGADAVDLVVRGVAVEVPGRKAVRARGGTAPCLLNL